MIVDQFSTAAFGGAGIAAMRIHRSLRQARVESRYWHVKPHNDATSEEGFHLARWSSLPRSKAGRALRKLLARIKRIGQKVELRRALAGRPAGLDIFTSPSQSASTPVDPQVLGSDILQLHWIAWMIDYPSFFASIPDDFPIVWTLHDMNAFTGGCHYSGGCEAFVSECKNCPQLGRPGENDLANRYFHTKWEALKGKNLHLVTPSRWLESEVRKSRILAHAKSVQMIHYGLDVDGVFSPQDKVAARTELNLPQDRVIVAFGAESFDNYRKGFGLLLEALRRLQCKSQVEGLVFGGGKIPRDVNGLPKMKSIGFIGNEQRKATVYSAADVFIMPSLEDNSPQTGIEAMACGTPVVAFDTGGVPDYVQPGKTGLLAEVGDAKHLARQIDWLIERPEEMRRLGAGARDFIAREMHQDVQTQKYIALYRNLIESHQQQITHQRAA